MSKIIVTISSSCSDQIDAEAIEIIREDCEEVVRAMGGHGVDVEVEVIP